MTCSCGKPLAPVKAFYSTWPSSLYGPEPNRWDFVRCASGHRYYHFVDSDYHVLAPLP